MTYPVLRRLHDDLGNEAIHASTEESNRQVPDIDSYKLIVEKKK
jgi:hypothetical protein